jgi:hypothetical protein
MRRPFRHFSTTFLFLIAVWWPQGFTQQTSEQDRSSCKRFTQEFYDWYAPLVQIDSHSRYKNVERQIRERESKVLTPKLLQALRADEQAQVRVKDQIVGLDFDPYVGGQDPADHYEARKLTLQGNTCSVEVWRSSPNDDSEKSDKPDVVAELVQQDHQWRFANFKYPQVNADLLSVLADMAKERSKSKP